MPKYDIFISYSRKDTAVADRICRALDAAGISYFIDRQGIAGGMEFPMVLADAICDSCLFLLLASKNSYESKFTNSEIIFAFNEKPKQSILPYIIDKSEMPRDMRFIFSGINWRVMDKCPVEPNLVDDLLNMLGRRRPKGTEILADYIANSAGSISIAEALKVKNFEPLIAEIIEKGKVGESITLSSLQRNYELGYQKAMRIMEQMEILCFVCQTQEIHRLILGASGNENITREWLINGDDIESILKLIEISKPYSAK